MIALVMILGYACGIGATIHAFAQPHSRWVAADRNRGWWLISMIGFTIFGITGYVVAAVYLIGVVPRFGATSDNSFQKDNAFQKR